MDENVNSEKWDFDKRKIVFSLLFIIALLSSPIWGPFFIDILGIVELVGLVTLIKVISMNIKFRFNWIKEYLKLKVHVLFSRENK